MNRYDDTISLRRRQQVFLAVRVERGVPDDVFVGCVDPGVEQLGKRGDETVFSGLLEGTPQRVRQVRVKKYRRFHLRSRLKVKMSHIGRHISRRDRDIAGRVN